MLIIDISTIVQKYLDKTQLMKNLEVSLLVIRLGLRTNLVFILHSEIMIFFTLENYFWDVLKSLQMNTSPLQRSKTLRNNL